MRLWLPFDHSSSAVTFIGQVFYWHRNGVVLLRAPWTIS